MLGYFGFVWTFCFSDVCLISTFCSKYWELRLCPVKYDYHHDLNIYYFYLFIYFFMFIVMFVLFVFLFLFIYLYFYLYVDCVMFYFLCLRFVFGIVVYNICLERDDEKSSAGQDHVAPRYAHGINPMRTVPAHCQIARLCAFPI